MLALAEYPPAPVTHHDFRNSRNRWGYEPTEKRPFHRLDRVIKFGNRDWRRLALGPVALSRPGFGMPHQGILYVRRDAQSLKSVLERVSERVQRFPFIGNREIVTKVRAPKTRKHRSDEICVAV